MGFGSVSWPMPMGGNGTEPASRPALTFGWHPPGTSAPLLAVISTPIRLFGSSNGHEIGHAPPNEPKRQPPPNSHLAPSSLAHSDPLDRVARFPPWRKFGLSPSRGPTNRHVLAEQGQVQDEGSIAVESNSGRRRRVYLARGGVTCHGQSSGCGTALEGFDIVDERQTHEDHLRALIHAYLLPNGFPDSVGPQYAPYMAWRGVQYFFGGAISVFTTQSLLGALGVAGRFQGEAAAAINWVIKDGAGRLGRLLFARWGRELDCELKQFRLAGDLLMEAGAALELATIYAPPAFLPLACTANLSKNLAAVAASSTRAPIYRTFALQNNLADITAKGESVANLADILGTVAGIALSRMRLPRMSTFFVLSVGYLLSSRKEVDSVELPYMNRARLAYSARCYLTDGRVPSVAEANHNEPLLPWGRYNQGRLVLGASVEAACAGPSDLGYAASRFPESSYRYLVTYRPDTKKAYILLRDGATSIDCLQASFFGHVFLHLLDGGLCEASLPQTARIQAGTASSARLSSAIKYSGSSNMACCGVSGVSASCCPKHAASVEESKGTDRWGKTEQPEKRGGPGGCVGEWAGALESHGHEGWRAAMERAQGVVLALYPDFISQAECNGWKLQQTMLNPKENRLLRLRPLEA
ncbi:hypothetical protein Vretimale_2630 [Volvox reticuliferus]|uniref:Uncharacterized protein n=1 Tax=Volvox reticuliferus TaxID=1737510 RepID=A0A8J4BXD6_9CHLO|nr:hypothetical protein Vretifemale_2058 [Volvox reticuliferus]GIL96901.1 hypothetical protein Vretimale_2630 [Volvox reticuliferus]